jgi:aminoglycoside 6'-N-acetyltransferase I
MPAAHVRLIRADDRDGWVRMRDALWPGSRADHERETTAHLATAAAAPIVFVAEQDGQLIGFLELDFRKYAPGCAASPVPCIEGWFVESSSRGHGVGHALVAAAEAHARAQGYVEIASDVAVENADGLAAHRAIGYKEIERVACFRRSLEDRQS